MKKALLLISVMILAFGFLGCQPKEVMSAKVYLQQKDYSSALEQLKTAGELYTNNSNVYNLLGQVYGELDSFVKMSAAFDKSLEIDSTFLDEIQDWRDGKSSEAFNKGLKAAKKEKWETAQKWYEIATIVDPNNSDALQNLGFVYRTTDQTEKAKITYTTAFEIDPKNEEIAIEAAQYYLESEIETDHKEALRILSLSIEHNPESANAFLLKGDAFSKLNMPDSALVCLEKAYELNPTDSQISFSIGALTYQGKDYTTAAKYFGIYTELEPDDESGYTNLSYSLLSASMFDEGVKVGKTMTDKFPASAEAWEQYAVFIAKGNTTVDEKRLGVVALSIAGGIKKIQAGDAKGALKELKDAIKSTGMKTKLPEIINAIDVDQAVKDEVLAGIK